MTLTSTPRPGASEVNISASRVADRRRFYWSVAATGESVVTRPSPLNAPKATYDHDCYSARPDGYQHLMPDAPTARSVRFAVWDAARYVGEWKRGYAHAWSEDLRMYVNFNKCKWRGPLLPCAPAVAQLPGSRETQNL